MNANVLFVHDGDYMPVFQDMNIHFEE
jgi:hypothetical protein